MLSPPVLPFGPSQEPTNAEWNRPLKPNGDPYIRGYHGGHDFQAPDHRNLAVDDYEIRWVNFGPALGNHQYVALDGTGGGWFDAHARSRPAQGTSGVAGDFLSLMGDEGSPGAVHRHLEYLEDWRDWYSTRNRTANLHETWEAENMALSNEDKAWVVLALDVRIQAALAAIFDGANNPNSPIIPDTPGWTERLKNNLKSIKAATSGGVDPAMIEAALRKVLREGTG